MDSITNPSDFQWVAIALVTVLSGARLARLIAFDHWPPVVWLRDNWDRATATSGWNVLLHCGWCCSVWTTLGIVVWGYLTDWNTAWWLFNATLGGAYAAGYVVSYDGDES